MSSQDSTAGGGLKVRGPLAGGARAGSANDDSAFWACAPNGASPITAPAAAPSHRLFSGSRRFRASLLMCPAGCMASTPLLRYVKIYISLSRPAQSMSTPRARAPGLPEGASGADLSLQAGTDTDWIAPALGSSRRGELISGLSAPQGGIVPKVFDGVRRFHYLLPPVSMQPQRMQSSGLRLSPSVSCTL
jgi:hypothetical protein